MLVSHVCGCVPELVEEGVNGWTFDPHDEPALAGRLARVASADCDRPAMGRASRRIVADWSLERFAQGFWEAARLAQRDAPTRSRRGIGLRLSQMALPLLLRKG